MRDFIPATFLRLSLGILPFSGLGGFADTPTGGRGGLSIGG